MAERFIWSMCLVPHWHREIGAVLGRVESQKKRSRYEAPLKPADPLYLQGL